MSAVADIYDWERVIAQAAATVFIDAGLQAFTVYSDPAFQKIRPRVEAIFKPTGEVTPKREAIMPDGTRRASAFKGELTLHAITDADAPGKNSHGEYRAQVRSICANLGALINAGALVKHKVQWMIEGATSHGIRTQDGFEQSTISFAVDFSVQGDAWPALFNGTN